MQGVKEALPALLEAFQELDADGSGCLTKEDCKKMFDWRQRPETYVASSKLILKNR
jgi:Ca2+-binding EF-hand superfamily protein